MDNFRIDCNWFNLQSTSQVHLLNDGSSVVPNEAT